MAYLVLEQACDMRTTSTRTLFESLHDDQNAESFNYHQRNPEI